MVHATHPVAGEVVQDLGSRNQPLGTIILRNARHQNRPVGIERVVVPDHGSATWSEDTHHLVDGASDHISRAQMVKYCHRDKSVEGGIGKRQPLRNSLGHPHPTIAGGRQHACGGIDPNHPETVVAQAAGKNSGSAPGVENEAAGRQMLRDKCQPLGEEVFRDVGRDRRVVGVGDCVEGGGGHSPVWKRWVIAVRSGGV